MKSCWASLGNKTRFQASQSQKNCFNYDLEFGSQFDWYLAMLKEAAHPQALRGLSNTFSTSQKSKQESGPFRAEEAGNGVEETAGKELPCEERGVTWQSALEKQLGKFQMPAHRRRLALTKVRPAGELRRAASLCSLGAPATSGRCALPGEAAGAQGRREEAAEPGSPGRPRGSAPPQRDRGGRMGTRRRRRGEPLGGPGARALRRAAPAGPERGF
ncbi:PREDICTED: uncharacterized protein LOC101383579 [Odobenus rosmarus divergens]|uniref:Uncharacterized protein LOC101383579 n=1 Tax=Odobenus rosmarus divergens TaxID=9708 RepID=A0A9B0GLH5_ODORO